MEEPEDVDFGMCSSYDYGDEMYEGGQREMIAFKNDQTIGILKFEAEYRSTKEFQEYNRNFWIKNSKSPHV